MSNASLPSGRDVDVIVVGAGAAGCVAARRLADAGLSVLVVEAGPSVSPVTVLGPDPFAALAEPGWVWPQDSVAYVRGRGLGGGSAVNGMVMMAGDLAYYEETGGAALVADLLRVTDELDPRPQQHGRLTSGFRAAARAEGYGSSPSSATLDQGGLITAALAFNDGQRRTVAQSHLSTPEPDRDTKRRIELLANAEVVALVAGPSGSSESAVGIAGREDSAAESEVAGVVIRTDGEERELLAGHVVLSAGAIASPRLLLGADLGNEFVGVGLKDHPAIPFSVSLGQMKPEERWPPRLTPPITTVLRSSSGLEPLDPLSMPVEPADGGLGLVLSMAARVASSGSVTLDAVDFGSLRLAEDRFRLRAAVRSTADLLRSPALVSTLDAVYIDHHGTTLEGLPQDDDALDIWLRGHLGGVYHAGCSCRFGKAVGPGGVVLEARGISVIDASVLPDLPLANPQLAVMAWASRLATQLSSVLVGPDSIP